VAASIVARCPSSSAIISLSGVRTKPGETQFTRMSGPYSSAADIVSAMTPAFAALYGPSPRVGRIPDTDAMFTIDPPPVARSSGTAARIPAKVPYRLTRMIRSNSRSV
jgi:hypothetical protein